MVRIAGHGDLVSVRMAWLAIAVTVPTACLYLCGRSRVTCLTGEVCDVVRYSMSSSPAVGDDINTLFPILCTIQPGARVVQARLSG